MIEAVDRISLLSAQLDQKRVGEGRPPLSWMQDTIPANQIVTTFGANHALDLLIRGDLSRGDTVLVDDLDYYPLFTKMKLAQLDVVGVPRTAQGPDLQALHRLAKQLQPKMFFTPSRAQNPTGSSMDLPTAHGVLKTALHYGMLVVDNDPFVDLPDQKGIRLAALDQRQSVTQVCSYSKRLSAGFRAGYIIAPRDICTDLTELNPVTSVNSSRFADVDLARAASARGIFLAPGKLFRVDDARFYRFLQKALQSGGARARTRLLTEGVR